jgi:hypothetical protein
MYTPYTFGMSTKNSCEIPVPVHMGSCANRAASEIPYVDRADSWMVGDSEPIVGSPGGFLVISLSETDLLLILTNGEGGDAAEGRRAGQAIFRGGQTTTSCLRAK